MKASGTARPMSDAGRGAVERHRRGRRHDPDRDRDRLPEAQLAAQAVRRRVRWSMPALALPSPVPSLCGGAGGLWAAGREPGPGQGACTLPHQALSIGSFAGGALAEPVQPVAHALGAQTARRPASGVSAAACSSSSPSGARAREQGEAEEELVDGEERGGDVAGRLGEGDLQVLAAAQRLQQGAEVAGGVEGLGSDAPRGCCSRARPCRGPCSAGRGRASAPRATPVARRGTAGRGSAPAGRRLSPAARGAARSWVGRVEIGVVFAGE